VDGLGLGDNAKAALIARGLAEMARLGEARGARSETFSGLAGMGDLIFTCWSRHGRNRQAGELIAPHPRRRPTESVPWKALRPHLYSVTSRGASESSCPSPKASARWLTERICTT